MGEFRIGRRFAQHSYPDGPRALSAAFASNFAIGPGSDQSIATSLPGTPVFTNVNGSGVEAGALTANGVPITPHVDGRVLFEAMVNVRNTAEGNVALYVYAQIDGTTSTDPIAAVTVTPGYESVPILFDSLTAFTLGTTTHLNLILVAGGAGLLLTAQSSSPPLAAVSTMQLSEIPLATG